MKKIFSALILLPSLSWGVSIPMGTFDQSKLEHLLRSIPEALVKSEDLGEFKRKHYVFPTAKSGQPFQIRCSSDFYGSATLPSEKRCEVMISDDVVARGDELKIKVTDPKIVRSFHENISYGDAEKEFHSNETLTGIGAQTGRYSTLFRYIIFCKREFCELTFSPKEVL